MKITDIKPQVKDKDRVNVYVDEKYRFSLDTYQLVSLGVKVGREYTEQELSDLEQESIFGKVYTRALEYCLMRPRSYKEVRDYLYRKTRDTRTKTGEQKAGVPKQITERVFERLLQKKYVDDERFAGHWVENRNQRKGISKRKLVSELRSKGVDQAIVDGVLSQDIRNDKEEIQKVIAKKSGRYEDEKLRQYLLRQGFSYYDIKQALED